MSFFLFWPLYIGKTTLSVEFTDRMIPVFSLIRTAIWNFELPLWNPFQDQGWATALVPIFWNPLHLLLGGLFSSPILALNALYLILILIAGWGFYKFSGLFLHHQFSPVIGGIIYPFCGYFLIPNSSIEALSGAAWSPAILYLIWIYIKKQNRSHLLLLAVSIYLFSTSANASFVLLLTGLILLVLPFHFIQLRPFRLSNLPALRIWGITLISSLLVIKIYYEQLLYFTKKSFFASSGTLFTNELTPGNIAPVTFSFFLLFTGMNLLQKPRRNEIIWTGIIMISLLYFQFVPTSGLIDFLHPVYIIFLLIFTTLLGLRGIEKTAYTAKTPISFLKLFGIGLLIILVQYLSPLEGNENHLIFTLPIRSSLFYSFLIVSSIFLICVTKPPFSIPIPGALIIIGLIFYHFDHQDQLYNSVAVDDFESHLYKPEKKSIFFDSDLPAGKWHDQDLAFGSFHHNTGTYTSQIVKDGLWPYESRWHNKLKNSNEWNAQMRFPLAYLSSDPGDFLTPDHLRFEDKINIHSESLNRYKIDILSSEPTQLVFNQNYHKNWRGYLNGKITPLLPTNISMIKTEIPAGLHQITLEYTSGGTHHLFWTMMVLLGGSLFLILRDHFSYALLLPGIPFLIIGSIQIYRSPTDASTTSTPESALWDYQMNYESKPDFWYLRPSQITTNDSYDGYRAEEMNKNHIYSATLQIPRNALADKNSIRYRFYIKADDEAELAVVAHSHTSDDEFYNIHYLRTFEKDEWEVQEGELDLPATSEPLIRTDFYIWNHKKDDFLIDNIQIQLIQ